MMGRTPLALLFLGTLGLLAEPLDQSLAAQALAGPQLDGARIGVAAQVRRSETPIPPTWRLDEEDRPALWKHLGVGFLGGAVVGFAVGRYLDWQHPCNDCFFNHTAGLVPVGAVAGLLTGGVVWAVRRAN